MHEEATGRDAYHRMSLSVAHVTQWTLVNSSRQSPSASQRLTVNDAQPWPTADNARGHPEHTEKRRRPKNLNDILHSFFREAILTMNNNNGTGHIETARIPLRPKGDQFFDMLLYSLLGWLRFVTLGRERIDARIEIAFSSNSDDKNEKHK